MEQGQGMAGSIRGGYRLLDAICLLGPVDRCRSGRRRTGGRCRAAHALQFPPAQGSELVDETHARVQLCVAGESFLQTRHANEHDANVSAIVEIAELFEARGFESVGFIYDEQVGRLPPHRCVGIAVPGRSCTQAVDCPHRLLTACSTVRGVLVTPGV